jgi:hypothetical protein
MLRKTALALAAVAAVSTAAMTPADAHWRGRAGPGLAFGAFAGALALGAAAAASQPYYYAPAPSYYYPAPTYYAPSYYAPGYYGPSSYPCNVNYDQTCGSYNHYYAPPAAYPIAPGFYQDGG